MKSGIFLGLVLIMAPACSRQVRTDETVARNASARDAEALVATGEPARPNQQGGGLARALASAGKLGKNVLVEYTSEDCRFCRKMNATTLADRDVKAALGDVYYVRIQAEEDPVPFTARWPDAGTPTFAVLTPDGRQRGDLVTGVLTKKSFMSYVDWATDPSGPMPALEVGGS